jgi:hypothetical protein
MALARAGGVFRTGGMDLNRLVGCGPAASVIDCAPKVVAGLSGGPPSRHARRRGTLGKRPGCNINFDGVADQQSALDLERTCRRTQANRK